MEQVTTEKLMADLRVVIGDAEALLKATAGQAGAAGVHEIDAQVRANPWAAVGIAAGVGLVIGVLLSRK